MKPSITAIGIANPIYKRNQREVAEIIADALCLKPAEKRLLKSIYKSTGIEYRYSVMSDFCKNWGEYEFFPNDHESPYPTTAARMQVYRNHALKLAMSAIANCCASSTFNLHSITHLITVSCTGMYAPGLDIEIVQELSLSPHVKRTAINFMGCYGSFNAIKMADVICRADHDAKVLIVSVELCTIHFQKNDSMDNIISNAIFADGAAAVIVEAESEGKNLTLEKFHCDLLPQHSQDMAWTIGDSGFDIVLSSYVPQAIQAGIAEFTKRLLKQQDLTLENIHFFAIHPGGYKILTACEAALSIIPIQNKFSYHVLREYGNMSSATILFVLKKLWDELVIKDKNKLIFSCAFGPGLTLEAMLLKVGF